MKIILYIASIVFANVITAKIAPLNIGWMLIPAGSFLIGATFIFRDLVQQQYGRKNTYLVIIIALIVSAIVSMNYGGLQIVIASALAFAVSETADTEVYSRLKLPFHQRVLWSGMVGSMLDSTVFVMVAGFPIAAIVGQATVKIIMQGIGALIIRIKANDSRIRFKG